MTLPHSSTPTDRSGNPCICGNWAINSQGFTLTSFGSYAMIVAALRRDPGSLDRSTETVMVSHLNKALSSYVCTCEWCRHQGCDSSCVVLASESVSITLQLYKGSPWNRLFVGYVMMPTYVNRSWLKVVIVINSIHKF